MFDSELWRKGTPPDRPHGLRSCAALAGALGGCLLCKATGGPRERSVSLHGCPGVLAPEDPLAPDARYTYQAQGSTSRHFGKLFIETGHGPGRCPETGKADEWAKLVASSLAHPQNVKKKRRKKKWVEAKRRAAGTKLPTCSGGPDGTAAGSSKRLASGFRQQKTGHCLNRR